MTVPGFRYETVKSIIFRGENLPLESPNRLGNSFLFPRNPHYDASAFDTFPPARLRSEYLYSLCALSWLRLLYRSSSVPDRRTIHVPL